MSTLIYTILIFFLGSRWGLSGCADLRCLEYSPLLPKSLSQCLHGTLSCLCFTLICLDRQLGVAQMLFHCIHQDFSTWMGVDYAATAACSHLFWVYFLLCCVFSVSMVAIFEWVGCTGCVKILSKVQWYLSIFVIFCFNLTNGISNIFMSSLLICPFCNFWHILCRSLWLSVGNNGKVSFLLFQTVLVDLRFIGVCTVIVVPILHSVFINK